MHAFARRSPPTQTEPPIAAEGASRRSLVTPAVTAQMRLAATLNRSDRVQSQVRLHDILNRTHTAPVSVMTAPSGRPTIQRVIGPKPPGPFLGNLIWALWFSAMTVEEVRQEASALGLVRSALHNMNIILARQPDNPPPIQIPSDYAPPSISRAPTEDIGSRERGYDKPNTTTSSVSTSSTFATSSVSFTNSTSSSTSSSSASPQRLTELAKRQLEAAKAQYAKSQKEKREKKKKKEQEKKEKSGKKSAKEDIAEEEEESIQELQAPTMAVGRFRNTSGSEELATTNQRNLPGTKEQAESDHLAIIASLGSAYPNMHGEMQSAYRSISSHLHDPAEKQTTLEAVGASQQICLMCEIVLTLLGVDYDHEHISLKLYPKWDDPTGKFVSKTRSYVTLAEVLKALGIPAEEAQKRLVERLARHMSVDEAAGFAKRILDGELQHPAGRKKLLADLKKVPDLAKANEGKSSGSGARKTNTKASRREASLLAKARRAAKKSKETSNNNNRSNQSDDETESFDTQPTISSGKMEKKSQAEKWKRTASGEQGRQYVVQRLGKSETEDVEGRGIRPAPNREVQGDVQRVFGAEDVQQIQPIRRRDRVFRHAGRRSRRKSWRRNRRRRSGSACHRMSKKPTCRPAPWRA